MKAVVMNEMMIDKVRNPTIDLMRLKVKSENLAKDWMRFNKKRKNKLTNTLTDSSIFKVKELRSTKHSLIQIMSTNSYVQNLSVRIDLKKMKNVKKLLNKLNKREKNTKNNLMNV